MSNWVKRNAAKVLDYVAFRLAENIRASTAETVRSLAAEQLEHFRSAAGVKKPQPLAIDQTTTHFYVHTSDGHRFFLDAKDLHISLHVLEHGHWEDHVRDVMMHVLRPGSTFIDVGGNVGLHSVFAASIVGPSGRVFTFEPLPHMFQTLKLNIDVNGLGSVVTPLQLAVSDVEETKNFANFRSHPAMSGFTVPSFRLENFNELNASTVETIQVSTTKLDAQFADQRVDGVKIDVEGYEALVIRGAHKVLKQNEDICLIIEWDPNLIGKTLGASAISETVAFLKAERFEPYIAIWQQPLRKISWETAPMVQGDLVVSRNGALDQKTV